MSKLVECVPNFSEGKNPQVLERIVEAIVKGGGIYLLGQEMDCDHHRSVVTFAGSPEAVLEAAFQGILEASKMINIQNHQGEHPRIGVTDVCPFIPLQNTTMEECIILARKLGERVGKELEIPVFLYENAASQPHRRNLANIRRGGLAKLSQKMKLSDHKPDFGPTQIHPTAGAIAIGARFFLLAYNVNLQSKDLSLAKKIAKEIREKDGGLPAVKALGINLFQREQVQVSMNLTDFSQTSLETVFRIISKKAAEAQVEVSDSEIIGLIPEEASTLLIKETLKLKSFSPEQIIERKISSLQKSLSLGQKSFLDKLATSSAVPGGGSACALAGALAASLNQMVTSLTKTKPKSEDNNNLGQILEQLMEDNRGIQDELTLAIESDGAAYQSFLVAQKLPRSTPEEKVARLEAINEAVLQCVLVPMSIVKGGLNVMGGAVILSKEGSQYAISDVGIACHLAFAAISGAILTIQINLSMVKDEELKLHLEKEIQEAKEKMEKMRQLTMDNVEKRLKK